jgi:hypothetical protein
VDYDPQEFDVLAFADAIQSRVTLNGIVLDSDNMSVTKLETVEIRVLHVSSRLGNTIAAMSVEGYRIENKLVGYGLEPFNW